jgi:riboflavin kinase/FMN adenylyltransferase
MKIVRHLDTYRRPFRHPVVSLGNFDGMHLGHWAILTRLVEEARAREGEALVITFFPHPLTILQPGKAPPLILGLREKLLLFADLGIDGVILQRFTLPFSCLSAQEFVRRYLVDLIGAEKIIVGHNVGFGRGRSGHVQTLQELAPRYNFTVEVIGPVMVGGTEVSSTTVRSLLVAGRMEEVSHLLGRYYAIEGRVEPGHRRGKGLGFPTANVRPPMDLLIPDGVYAVFAQVGAGREQAGRLKGVANIGTNPTFGGTRRTLEVYLFDFAMDLYGKWMRVAFVNRLRGEVKFPSPEALVRQIEQDVDRAHEALAQADTGDKQLH